MLLTHSDYTVACICPMGVELAPAKALLDEIHPRLSTQRDQNSYVLGKMGEHSMVIAVLPEIGNNPASISDNITRDGNTWTLSFTRTMQQSPRAAHLLRFLAYLDHQDIWFELFRRGQGENQPGWFTELAGDEFVFEDAMHVLTRYCLMEAHYQTGSYSLHPCVHDWTLDGLNEQIDARRYWLAFDCVASHIGADDQDCLSAIRYQRFTRHAKRLVHCRFQATATQHDSIRTRLYAMVRLAQLLTQQEQYTAAELMYLRALQGKEEALGPAHTSTLMTVNSLGNLYANQGKLGEAEKIYLRALQGYQKALGVELVPSYLPALHTMFAFGDLYSHTDRKDMAKIMYTRALSGYTAVQGPSSRWCHEIEGRLQAL